MGSGHVSLKNSFKPNCKQTFSTPENQSKGILDDFAVRKDVQTRSLSTNLFYILDSGGDHSVSLSYDSDDGNVFSFVGNLTFDSDSQIIIDSQSMLFNCPIQSNIQEGISIGTESFGFGSLYLKSIDIVDSGASKFHLYFNTVGTDVVTFESTYGLTFTSDAVVYFTGSRFLMESMSDVVIYSEDGIETHGTVFPGTDLLNDLGKSDHRYNLVYAKGYLGWGISPVGTVQAWLKSYTNTPPLPDGWVEANGQTLSDADSVYNGQIIPNLNGSSSTQRFLRGCTSSGTTGGCDSCHTHSVSGCNATVQSGTGATVCCLACTTSGGTAVIPSHYHVVWILRVK